MSLPTYFLRQPQHQPSRDRYVHPEDYDPVLRAHCRLDPEPQPPATPVSAKETNGDGTI